MRTPFLLRIAATIAATALSPALYAQSDDHPSGPPREDRNQITIGIGGGLAPRFDGDDDYKLQPGGIVRGKVEGFEFAMRGLNLYIDLVREKPGGEVNFIAGPVAQLRTERTGGLKDPRIQLLGEKDAAIELGAFVGIGKRGVLIPPDSLTFDISFVHDVANVHDSYIIKPAITYASPLSKRTFASLGVSADYVGGGYGRTYFDTPALTASVPTISGYATDGAGLKSIGTSLLLAHDLGGDNRKGWGLFALTGYSRLLGQYARSSLVREAGDADQFLAIFGIGYSF
jgi:outer membrane scaffolding protein for murein synthesis (MipA/OmpV family)